MDVVNLLFNVYYKLHCLDRLLVNENDTMYSQSACYGKISNQLFVALLSSRFKDL